MDEDDASTVTESSEDRAVAPAGSFRKSSFVGDESGKRKYERDVARYNPNEHWRCHNWNLQVIAARAVKRAPQEWPTAEKRQNLIETDTEEVTKKNRNDESNTTVNGHHKNDLNSSLRPPKLFNPYEGEEMALQLDESIPDFLSRLPPSSVSTDQPWIFVANFRSPRRLLDENVALFRQQGYKLLADYLTKKQDLEARSPEKPASAITRILTPDRKILEADLKTLAKKNGVTCGKWMLFPQPSKVDQVWATVVQATVDGRLGCAAKVATSSDRPNSPSRLVCIYTENFAEVEDVKGVLKEIRRLKLIESAGHTTEGDGRSSIYYKCDAYTHLDITSQNEYKLKASMYSSRDMFAEMKSKGEL